MSANIKPQDVEKLLNLGDTKYSPLMLGSQIMRRGQRIARGVYDFTRQGGAVSTINLLDPVYDSLSKPAADSKLTAWQPLVLPPNALIVRVLFDTVIALTSGGSATLAFGSGQAANDFLTATAKTSFAINTRLDGIPVHSAATAVKIPSTQAAPGSIPTVTIGTAAATAGKINVHIEYYLSD